MPEATLKFKLPKEQTEFKIATKAGDLVSCITEVHNSIRNKIKYCDLTDEEEALYSKLLENINICISDHGLDEILFE